MKGLNRKLKNDYFSKILCSPLLVNQTISNINSKTITNIQSHLNDKRDAF